MSPLHQDDLFPFDLLDDSSDPPIVQLPDLNQLPEFDEIDTGPILQTDSTYLDTQEAATCTTEPLAPSHENNPFSAQLVEYDNNTAIADNNSGTILHVQHPDDLPGDLQIPANVPKQTELKNSRPAEMASTTFLTDFTRPTSPQAALPLDIANMPLVPTIKQSFTEEETQATQLAQEAENRVHTAAQNGGLPPNKAIVDNADDTNTKHSYSPEHDIQVTGMVSQAAERGLNSRLSTSSTTAEATAPHSHFVYPYAPIPASHLPIHLIDVQNQIQIQPAPTTLTQPLGPNNVAITKTDSGTTEIVTQDTSVDSKIPNSQTPKRPRLRFSRNAQPSNYCHICGRCGNKVDIFQCANVPIGLCRKVLCEKCILIYEPQNLELARQNARGWFCTHCRGICPRKARCIGYSENNRRRRERNEENKRLKREREEREKENNEPERKRKRRDEGGDDGGDSPTGISDCVF